MKQRNREGNGKYLLPLSSRTRESLPVWLVPVLFLALLCLIFPFTMAFMGVAEGAPAPYEGDLYKNSWAVLIGINKYYNKPWSDYPLDYADADAKSMAKLLVERFGFKKENIVLLVDDKAGRELSQDPYYSGFRIKLATLAGIRSVLGELNDLRKVSKEDRVLVFYAGHGYTLTLPSGGEMGFIVPMDGRGKEAATLYATAIAMSEFRNLSELVAAKHVLFLLDACFSGLATSRYYAIPPTESEYIKKVAKLRVRQIITAGGKGEQVVESSKWGHSAFTFKLLEALGEGVADRDGDGFITGRELANYLRPVVTNFTKGLQTPQEGRFFGEGEFIFSLTAGTANLMVSSDPLGANVYLNGELKGNTRDGTVMILELRPGSYKLVIRKEGHYDYEEVVVLERGKEKPIAVKLIPRPATILVNAWPLGAKVYVDGNLKGISRGIPVEVGGLSPGTHRLKIAKKGYREYAQVLTLKPGEKREISQTLVSMPTTVLVDAWPAGAKVYLEGELKGSTGEEPIKITDLKPGQYKLRISKKGYKDHQEVLIVGPGEKIERFVNLPTMPSVLVITSMPAGAKAYINDKYVGDTDTKREMPPGIYKVVIEKEGYEKYESSVRLEQGERELIYASLVKKGIPPRVTPIKPPEVEPPKPTSLTVLSVPAGASIYADDKYLGTTPATISDLRPGTYKVIVKKEDYHDWMQHITLEPGEPYKLLAELMTIEIEKEEEAVPREAALVLSSSPSGASIYIDDEPIDERTPFTVRELALGSHKISLKMEGYSDWAQYVTLEPGEQRELFAKLPPLTASLMVSSDPSGGLIYIDDQYANEATPAFIGDLQPGTHKVAVKMEGYHEWTKYVELEPGKTHELPMAKLVEVEPLMGTIRVLSDPPGGMIYVDGKPINEQTPVTLRDIEPGTYVVEVKKEGYQGWSGKVEIRPGENPTLEASLGMVVVSAHNARRVLKDNLLLTEDVRAISVKCLNIMRDKIYICQNTKYLGTKEKGRGVIVTSGTANWKANIYYNRINEIRILDPWFGPPNGLEIRGDFEIFYQQAPRVYEEAGIKEELDRGRLYLPCKGDGCQMAKSALESLIRGR